MRNDSLIDKSMDFSKKNYMSLPSLHEITKRIVFPDLYKEEECFDIFPDDRDFLLNTMKTLPAQEGYDKKEYFDSFGKFFMFGDTKEDIPNHIKIYNKVGYAYGYLTDSSYVHDTKNNIEFILSATIHVNKNGIFNDDIYEYDEIGIPFLAQLGREIYALHKKHKKF